MLNPLAAVAHSILDSRLFLRLAEIADRRSDNRITELGMLSHAFEFRKINGVEGDYFEFGLWRGKTFTYAHRMKRRYNQTDMLLWGFDSFEGLPGIDDKKNNIWSKGSFSCTEAELRAILQRNGLRDEEYRLVAGFYQKSLNEDLHQRLQGRQAAIVYVDCDLYSSTVEVLRFIRRYLVTGSIVCFDDFYNYKGSPYQGEQRALNEFIASHP